ncbi:DNA polymerase III subunit gamma and tau [Acidipropionibacterium virtanenii]|uniref:DNA polymerase III subunit gamma and tau n=1 Tax=Acidipropionibacterium virtanenii TaxID=2057246 RepID=UPI003CCC58B6
MPEPDPDAEPVPADDVDDGIGEDADAAYGGPETPIESEGLESEEDAEPGDLPLPPVEETEIEETEPEPEVDVPGPEPADDVPEPPLALYRRYRPETFDEVIGQEHVTEPLKRAIINNRVNHAYLFSGPRGCGKTTSARILARALNCEKGPTPTPCGVCQSCRDLARGGSGSIDVIEIDAASHGGVDDARDLRERAFFAPVASRYKIYIIDEAHMVTTQGFNALLKLVEEPPPHVKFIFATTEPEKVIGTIRSRTHHYPFRLVPPKTLVTYLEQICHQEGIAVDHAVLPLVVRAGGGSVRDSLSVLDQLLGGAQADGVSYEQAAALLGYTPDALLDQIVDAFAAGDAHEVFATIDKVIEVGQDPRRFAEDLLRRMRDLVILAAVPDACTSGLIDVSPEQATRLSHQVAGLGSGELTRAAEVLATGLTQMRGTTAPRLHLELMCSRILLPGADAGDRGYSARLDRLERRMGMDDGGPEGAPEIPAPGPEVQDAVAAPNTEPVETPQPRQSFQQPSQGAGDRAVAEPATGQPSAEQPSGITAPSSQPSTQSSAPRTRRRPRPSSQDYAPGGRSPEPRQEQSRGEQPPQEQPQQRQPQQDRRQAAERPSAPRPDAVAGAQSEGGTAPSGGGSSGRGHVDIAMVRRAWPQVLDAVRAKRKVAGMVLSQYAQVIEVHGRTATVAFANPGAREMFESGPGQAMLHDAVMDVLGADLTFTPVLGGGQGPTGPAQPGPSRPDPDRPGPPGPGGGYGPDNDPGYGPGPEPGDPQGEPPGPSEPGREQTDRDRAVDVPVGPDGVVPGAFGPDGVVPAGAVPGRPENPAGPVPGGPEAASTGRGTPPAAVTPPSAPSPASTSTPPEQEVGDPVTGGDAGAIDEAARRAMTHRWSERAKERIRAMSHHVEEPPSPDEVPEEADWTDSEIVESPSQSPAQLIMAELGGVVIDDPLVQQ